MNAPSTPSVDPQMIRILNRIQDASSRLSQTVGLTDEIGSRLFGAVPKATSGKSGGPATDGSLSLVHAALDYLHETLTDAEQSVSRLTDL